MKAYKQIKHSASFEKRLAGGEGMDAANYRIVKIGCLAALKHHADREGISDWIGLIVYDGPGEDENGQYHLIGMVMAVPA
jgi:hypothetical protein